MGESGTRRPWARWITLLVLAGSAGGCFNAGIHPRTAELLPEGEVGGGGTFTVGGYAPGEFFLADGRTATGDTAMRSTMHALGYLLYIHLNTAGHVRYAPLSWLELGWDLGIQHQGMEVRFALLDERAGAPLSMAASVEAAWRPFEALDAGWFAAGFDLSRRFGVVAPLLNVYLTYGVEAHALSIEGTSLHSGCGSFGDPGCGEYGPPPSPRAVRDELRLNVSAGVSFAVGDEYEGILRVQPYVVLWADDFRSLSCDGCSNTKPVDFEEVWGMHFTLGLGYTP